MDWYRKGDKGVEEFIIYKRNNIRYEVKISVKVKEEVEGCGKREGGNVWGVRNNIKWRKK
jgi:hypothetical protein